MKICVYAICKNEEKFAKRWYESMKEADEIYVLDTGSTDNTVKILKDLGVFVETEIISPWRFDVARNKSLELVSEDADLCVCTDLDEVLEPGWRKKLEENYDSNITRYRYNYNWSFDEYGKPAVNFYLDNIHIRNGYKWTHPVHEVLVYEKAEKYKLIEDIVLNHYQDFTKSRSSYLPLLEMSVEECPEDDRNTHYLGREYMYYGKYEKAIEMLKRHLKLKSATWKDERCASMRFIGRSYKNLNDYDESKNWYLRAVDEAPYLREPYVELGMLEYNNKKYDNAVKYLKEALKIEKNTKSYINEPYCYDGTVEDVLSICLYYIGLKEESLMYAKKALELKPNDERIKNNIKLIEG